MRATYSNVTPGALVAGVEFAKATATIVGAGTDIPVSDRLSKFKLFTYIELIQSKYGIPEEEIDQLLILIKEDASQSALESEIE